jgi:hypothetical protein
MLSPRFDVELYGGAIGLDVKSDKGESMIGWNNRIHVRARGWAAPTLIVDLPEGWHRERPTRTTNDVVINGVRRYPPGDEF